MAIGIDFAFNPHPSIAAARAAGDTFVCRYISPNTANDTNGKNLLPAEKVALLAAGISIVLVFESSSGRMLSGKSAGVTDAKDADAVVKALGMAGMPVYFACDFDATPAQQTPINAYLDGVASVIGKARTGIYGGYYPVKRAFDAGKVTYGWQSYAWSGGLWDSRAQLRQVQNGTTLGGASIDKDTSMTADYGQFPRPASTVKPTSPPAPPPPPAPAPTVDWDWTSDGKYSLGQLADWHNTDVATLIWKTVVAHSQPGTFNKYVDAGNWKAPVPSGIVLRFPAGH